MVGSSTFAAAGGMEVETSAGSLPSSCPAMVATEFAMRFTGVRKSGISMKASTIATNQKRCSCVSSASRQRVEQNLLRLVRHSFRKRVDGKENHTRQNDTCDDKPQRNVEENIGFAGRRDEERQMVGS